jgi:hypothetical protein
MGRRSAHGAGRSGDVEIIDLLDVEDGWMPYQGDVEPTVGEADLDPQRSRRAWIGAAVAVTVVAGALAVVSIDSEAPTAAPTTSTQRSAAPAPTTTTTPPSTTAEIPTRVVLAPPRRPRVRVVPIVVDPPAGFQWSGGYEDDYFYGQSGTTVVYSNDAEAEWIVLQAIPSAGGDVYATGERRVDLGSGRVALVTTLPTTTTASLTTDDFQFTVTSNAPTDSVLEFLASVRMGEPTAPIVDASLGFERLATITSSNSGGDPWTRSPSATLSMRSSSDEWIFVTTAPPLSASHRKMWNAILPDSTSEGVRWGLDAFGQPTVLVPMVNQDVFLSAGPDTPLMVLIDLASRLRLATTDEWSRLESGEFDQVVDDRILPSFLAETFPLGEATAPLAVYTQPEGSVWVGLGDRWGAAVLFDPSTGAPQLSATASATTTYVFAVAPSDLGGTLVVSHDDGRSTSVALVAIDDTWPYVLAVAEISDLGGWTASIVASDGSITVLA